MKKKTLVEINNIKKNYKNGDSVTCALKGINLEIYEGEFLLITGESGCGKTTLLNIIGGLDRADEGEFYFDGILMNGVSKRQLTKYRRENVGFVFQSYNLMPNLNSKQNLDLIAELVDDHLDSETTLEKVGLNNKLNNYPSQLSGGEQQRVSIARSLVKKPRLILADEPTAALDYKTSIEVLEQLSLLPKNGTTLVMVSHNREIGKLANRVVRLQDGKIVETKMNNHPKKASELVW